MLTTRGEPNMSKAERGINMSVGNYRVRGPSADRPRESRSSPDVGEGRPNSPQKGDIVKKHIIFLSDNHIEGSSIERYS